MKQVSKIMAALVLSTLVTSVYSQTIIRTVDGKNYWTETKSEEFVGAEDISVYVGRRVLLIPMSDIMLYEDLEKGLKILQPNKLQKVDPVAFNGKRLSFMAKGKRVYIPLASNSTQQRWGARRLQELITENGYWQIVGCEEEADFIMEYIFDDKGKDHAYIIISDRFGRAILKTESVGATDWVPAHAGRESAEKLLKKLKRTFKDM